MTTIEPTSLFSKTVYDLNDQKVDGVQQVFANDKTGEATWVTVNTNAGSAREVFIPLDHVTVEGEKIRAPYTIDSILNSPKMTNDKSLTAEEEETLREYYAGVRNQGKAADKSAADKDADAELAPKGTVAGTAAAAGTAGVVAGLTAGKAETTEPTPAPLQARDADVTPATIDSHVSTQETSAEGIEFRGRRAAQTEGDDKVAPVVADHNAEQKKASDLEPAAVQPEATTGEKAAAKADEVKDAAAEKAEDVKAKAAEAKDAAAEKAEEAKLAAAEKADEVKVKAADAKDAAAEKAAEVKDAAAEKAAEVKDAAAEKAAEVKDAAAEKAEDAKLAAAAKADEVKVKAADAKDAAVAKAAELKDTAVAKAEEVKAAAAAKVEDVKVKAAELKDNAQAKVASAKSSNTTGTAAHGIAGQPATGTGAGQSKVEAARLKVETTKEQLAPKVEEYAEYASGFWTRLKAFARQEVQNFKEKR